MESHSQSLKRMPQHDSISSTTSEPSNHSQSTAPTSYSQYPVMEPRNNHNSPYDQHSRDSIDTYASTIPSAEDESEIPQIEVVEDRYEYFPSEAIASNPPSFGELFPSTRKLTIRHDDTTVDGNMNVRVNTSISTGYGNRVEVILFHLRMYSLHNRNFSLRRYCRDSGRELCHSSRKQCRPTGEKISLQRPLSSALSSLRAKSEPDNTATSSLQRQDSGYKSGTEDCETVDEKSQSLGSFSMAQGLVPTNTILLEFSNYAHVEVKRRGVQGMKHYDFEYWSTKYQWKRTVHKDGDAKAISYHLLQSGSSKPVAHIYPEHLTPLEALEEQSKGGWVPPCSMWISDPSLFKTMNEVAEYVYVVTYSFFKKK